MMLTPPPPDPAQKATHTGITALFGNAKLILDETPTPVSPFGDLASFIAVLGRIGFAGRVQRHLPFAELTSNNAILQAQALTAFLMAVVVWVRRFAHADWLRADRVFRDAGVGAFRPAMTGRGISPSASLGRRRTSGRSGGLYGAGYPAR